MDENDMIMPVADDAAAEQDTNQATQTGEVTGELLDNDEVQNDESKAVADGASQTDDEGSKADDANATTSPGDATTSDDTQAAKEGAKPSVQAHDTQPAAKLDSPGDFQPKDYAFDVTLADGSTIRVEKPEDIDNIPADADFGTPANLAKMQAAYTKMVVGIENDKRDYDARVEAFNKQEESTKELETRIEVMVNELNYLENKGKLPKVDPKYADADWSDPEIAKQPGVKERLELLEFRAKENAERERLNLSPMSLLEASREMAAQVAEQAETDRQQKQAALRKQKGAMVSGPTGMPSTSMPDDMIVGVGGSIRDIA